MSFSRLGYSYSASSQFFVSATSSTTCYTSQGDSDDVSSGSSQTATLGCCTTSYEHRLPGRSRTELGAALGLYGSPYAAAAANPGYLSYGADAPTFYTALNSQYDLKDGSPALHPSIAQPATAAYYTYDHSFRQYDRYGTVGFSCSSRRKNATRETTSTLKTWLYEHRKNPYPTKGEKIMLAIITKMTLTQVSTWFANARRRLKKENRMTWSPKTKTGEEQRESKKRTGEGSSSENEDKDLNSCRKGGRELCLSALECLNEEESERKGEDEPQHLDGQEDLTISRVLSESEKNNCAGCLVSRFQAVPYAKHDAPMMEDFLGHKGTTVAGSLGTPSQLYAAPDKPRIWSLAHTVGEKMIVGSSCNFAQRTESPECLVLRGRSSGTGGQWGEEKSLDSLMRTQPIHEKPSEELPQPAKMFKNSAFNLQSIALNYASYPILGETCQFAAEAEGFQRSVRTPPNSLDLSDASLSYHKEKLKTAFRPLLER